MIPVDVFIPCALKDLDVLGLCIESLKRNLENEIKQLFIVGKDDNAFIKFCFNNASCEFPLIFIDERRVTSTSIEELNSLTRNNGSWIYQQILKLNSFKLGKSSHMLVFDADKILIKRQKYLDDEGNSIFYVKRNDLAKQKNMFGLLDGSLECQKEINFITDRMIFDKSLLKKMFYEIGQEEGVKKALIEGPFTNISEYQLYGSYFMSVMPQRYKLVNSHGLQLNKILPLDVYEEAYSDMPIDTIDLHSQFRKDNFKI